jgi:hypothetical protein
LAEDTSAESRTSVAAPVDTSSSTETLIAALPSAAASLAQALVSSPRGRIGGTTIGATVACHGGSGRHPVGASAYADPLDAISLVSARLRRGSYPQRAA